MATLFLFLDVIGATVAIILAIRIWAKKNTAHCPPGPKGYPIIGNLFDIPSTQEWLAFAELGDKYGPISSLSFFGQKMIIVNSAKVASDFSQRGSVYEDRPTVPMAGELVGWSNSLVLLRAGKKHRKQRILSHKLFGNNLTMQRFHPVEEREAHKLLQRLLATPSSFSEHVRKTAGAIILEIIYGYQVQETNDPFVALADRATEQFSVGSMPAKFAVNLIPQLARIPEWFPGGGFKRIAREWAITLEETVNEPWQFVARQMAAGVAPLSFVSNLIQDQDIKSDDEEDVKWLALSLYTGGAETTVAAIRGFFKAMLLFPDVQRRAQAELDSVIGNDRLPTFTDRGSLPYINAVVLEVIRWFAVIPTGLPHVATRADFYDKYYIPKGSMLIVNVWKILHDPDVYKEPFAFNPDRFLVDGELDPKVTCFGFGKRICPGRVLADASIFITAASVLSTFNITPSPNVLLPNQGQTDGVISHPTEFDCTILPRSLKAIELIKVDPKA